MAVTRKKSVPQGAPEWVLTYGDMMSLLLCFFILLAALSELRKEDRFSSTARSIQQGFGMKHGGGVPTELPFEPRPSIISFLEALERKQKETELSTSQDVGQEGKQPRVQSIRESQYRTDGGRITFAPGSAELTSSGRQALDQVAALIAGYTNRVEIRGHAWSGESPSAQYPDHFALSHARARAAADYLVEKGISKVCLRLVACGSSEPVVHRVYSVDGNQSNRRVEIIVSSALTVDSEPLPSATSASGL